MLLRTHTEGNAHWGQIFTSKSFPLEAKLIKRWLRISFVLLWGQTNATNPFCGQTRFWKPQTLIKARLIVKKQSSSIGKTGKGVSKHKQA